VASKRNEGRRSKRPSGLETDQISRQVKGARTELEHQVDQAPEFTSPEVDQGRASGLQGSVGNEALNSVLRAHGRVADAGQSSADVDQGSEVELEGGGGLEFDEAFADYLSAIGARERGGSGWDAEDWRKLYGGDADPPPPQPRRVSRFRRVPKIISMMRRDEDELEPDLRELPEEQLPPLRAPEEPRGDERLDALWSWLRDPLASAGKDLQPEDLVQREGGLERCATLGRFLQGSAGDRLARVLGGLARPLPGSRSKASVTARAACLAELGLLREAERLGSLEVANRAACLALESDAPQHARAAARAGRQQHKMAADGVLEVALGDEVPPVLAALTTDRRGRALLESGLRFAVAPQALPALPPHTGPMRLDTSSDPSTASIDELLGGRPEGQGDRLTFEHLASPLEAADTLLLLAGRSQVELAAAGLAVLRGAGRRNQARILARLRIANARLRELARRTAGLTGRLEEQVGGRYEDVCERVERLEAELEEQRRGIFQVREGLLELLAEEAA
jgi:hypothetical protein